MLPTFCTLLLALPAQLTPMRPPDAAEALERRITPEVLVARSARPAVVHITTDVVRPGLDFFFRPMQEQGQSSGSGVVIFEDGFVVTNYHVVRDAVAVRVRFDQGVDDREYSADVVSFVPEEDLALLKIRGENPFPTVPMGTSADLMVGERVIAIGNPFGQTFTVSSGIISGLHRNVATEDLRFTDLIQTDASINPGNSGGPLLNINGELIGINTAMNRVAQNIGFAIPVDRVKQVLYDHLLSPNRARAWFGFAIDEQRLEVTAVLPGSPAAKAGFQVGDRVVQIEERAIEKPSEYTLARLPLVPGRVTRFGLSRDEDLVEVELAGWERLSGLLFERLGLNAKLVVLRSRHVHRAALRVENVRPGGPADRLGVLEGDYLEALRVQTQHGPRTFERLGPDELGMLVNRMPSGARVVLEVWRDANGNGVRDYALEEVQHGTLELD